MAIFIEPLINNRVPNNMKRYLLLLLLCSGIHVYGESRKALEYKIVSDTKSDTISKGFCIITGQVYEGYPSANNDMKISNGVVSTTDHVHRAPSNKEGQYVLRIPSDSWQLYFFKPQYKEIVTGIHAFQDQHIIEIDFYAQYERNMIEVKKPVVYLYPEQEEDISVQLSPVGDLTFTYPRYENGWDVSVKPNGLMTDNNGRDYPYLFWEAEQKQLSYKISNNEMEGFVIRKDDVIDFLENQLSLIGLNDTEATDFITFWGPILQKKEYALVQFLLDEEYDQKVGLIETVPEMQSVKRVYMLCTGFTSLDEIPKVVSQTFKPFERKGGVLVEWGGSEISLDKNVN